MSSEINAHQLTRDIPDPIARKIRQQSGFGCIFCGVWIYQYEHIIPEFKDATEHDPNKIALLCGYHHQKVTNKRLSKQQVFEQYKHPLTLQNGYASEFLQPNKKFGIVLGRIFIPEPKGDILTIDDTPIISMTQPTLTEPLKLDAKFYDNEKNLIMEIVKNEQRGYTRNWDIEQKGSRTFIRRKRGDIVLQINIVSENILKFEKINMIYGNTEIISDSQTGKIFMQNKGVKIDFPTGQIITRGINMKNLSISLDGVIIMGAQKGIPLIEMDYQMYMETGRIQSVTNSN